MLSQYGPALLVRCQDQIDFGKELVGNWLKTYMFKNEPENIPDKIAEYLSNHANFKTHGKHINIEKAKEIGLKILPLEDNQIFKIRFYLLFMRLCMHLEAQIREKQ